MATDPSTPLLGGNSRTDTETNNAAPLPLQNNSLAVQARRDCREPGQAEVVSTWYGSTEGNNKYAHHPHQGEARDSDNEDTLSIMERAKKFTRRRFWWLCLLGVVFLIVLELSFLPRTSLSRDFRRWYELPLTKNDISRHFLVLSGINRTVDGSGSAGSNEQELADLIGNFSALNAYSPVNLASSDNYGLVSFVESRFKSIKGFRTKSYTYDAPWISHPRRSSLKLYDDSNTVVYDAKLVESSFKTPAFFSRNSTFAGTQSVKSPYIFVNEGKREDYQLLIKEKLNVEGKIVLVRSGSVQLSVGERMNIAKSFGASGFIMYSEPPAFSQNDSDNKVDNRLERAIYRDGIWDSSEDTPLAIPVSYESISPILSSLGKPSRDGPFQNWTTNPQDESKLLLEIETEATADISKVTNVIAKLDGILHDGEVVIGCSRDSLTSTDPLSGHAVMIQIMEHFQSLLKLGWKPLRPLKFVSWDATHSGLAGSKFYFEDPHAYDSNMPVVAYINIDGNTVTGSKFQVEGHPALHHLLKSTAKYIPIPSKSRLSFSGRETTLYKYWKKQDGSYISPYLGDRIKHTDALNFQQHLGAPVVNVKFSNDPKRDPLIHTPNSNYYSSDWITNRDIDKDMLLHGLLVRYLGLLSISLVEKEVADRQISSFIKQIQDFFIDVTADIEKEWVNREVPSFLVNKADIYTDIQPQPLPNKPITFVELVVQFNILIDHIIDQSRIYDQYNKQVEKNLIKDYAWYHLFMKVKHYAQFKVANYKLLRLEQELMLSKPDEFQYLYSMTPDDPKPWLNHVVFGLSTFDKKASSSVYAKRNERGMFSGIQRSFEEKDFEQSVRWLVVSYSKLKGFHKKIQ